MFPIRANVDPKNSQAINSHTESQPVKTRDREAAAACDQFRTVYGAFRAGDPSTGHVPVRYRYPRPRVTRSMSDRTRHRKTLFM
jgi:hypothetical protein